nr:FAD-dependent oxidoreductase [Angustibacter aerolatus]
MAVGSVPNTAGIGLEESGVALTPSGHVQVDGVSRTSARGVYAAGDCTGVLPLASVAAMQGRIAMFHSLGDAVQPLNLRAVAANIFTDPEIATVGWSGPALEQAGIAAETVMLPLATNARAKMQNVHDGFVKALRPRRHRHRHGRRRRRPRASEPGVLDRARRADQGSPSTRSRPASRSTRRCPAPSPKQPARLHTRAF